MPTRIRRSQVDPTPTTDGTVNTGSYVEFTAQTKSIPKSLPHENLEQAESGGALFTNSDASSLSNVDWALQYPHALLKAVFQTGALQLLILKLLEDGYLNRFHQQEQAAAKHSSLTNGPDFQLIGSIFIIVASINLTIVGAAQYMQRKAKTDKLKKILAGSGIATDGTDGLDSSMVVLIGLDQQLNHIRQTNITGYAFSLASILSVTTWSLWHRAPFMKLKNGDMFERMPPQDYWRLYFKDLLSLPKTIAATFFEICSTNILVYGIIDNILNIVSNLYIALNPRDPEQIKSGHDIYNSSFKAQWAIGSAFLVLQVFSNRKVWRMTRAVTTGLVYYLYSALILSSVFFRTLTKALTNGLMGFILGFPAPFSAFIGKMEHIGIEKEVECLEPNNQSLAWNALKQGGYKVYSSTGSCWKWAKKCTQTASEIELSNALIRQRQDSTP